MVAMLCCFARGYCCCFLAKPIYAQGPRGKTIHGDWIFSGYHLHVHCCGPRLRDVYRIPRYVSRYPNSTATFSLCTFFLHLFDAFLGWLGASFGIRRFDQVKRIRSIYTYSTTIRELHWANHGQSTSSTPERERREHKKTMALTGADSALFVNYRWWTYSTYQAPSFFRGIPSSHRSWKAADR